MNEFTIKNFIGKFERCHKGVEIKYSYDIDNIIHNFTMFYGDKCIEMQVSDLYLNLTICENPLPYCFDKMAYQLGVTLINGWER